MFNRMISGHGHWFGWNRRQMTLKIQVESETIEAKVERQIPWIMNTQPTPKAGFIALKLTNKSSPIVVKTADLATAISVTAEKITSSKTIIEKVKEKLPMLRAIKELRQKHLKPISSHLGKKPNAISDKELGNIFEISQLEKTCVKVIIESKQAFEGALKTKDLEKHFNLVQLRRSKLSCAEHPQRYFHRRQATSRNFQHFDH